MSEKQPIPVKHQEYKIQTEILEDGTIKILKREKTDFTTMIYPFEADIMNNGATKGSVENEAASVSGKLYLPVKEKKDEAKAAAEKAGETTREEVLTATKNADLREIANKLTDEADTPKLEEIKTMIKKDLVAYILEQGI